MRRVRYILGVGVAFFVAVSMFERVAPYQLIKLYWKLVNPIFRVAAGVLPGLVVFESVGRRTGLPHRVPLGGRVENGSVWVVVGHASKNATLRNITADPNVRVRVGGRWRHGLAAVVENDDARRRAIRVNALNGLFQAMSTSDQVSVRIDLLR